MKALTLSQPWATLVALGVKTVETRSWSTAYRGPLLIHAGRGNEDVDFSRHVAAGGLMPAQRPPLGVIVAKARLVDVVPTSDLAAHASRLTPLERELGDYSPGRFAWILEDVEPIDPPPAWRGALGLWDGPEL